MVWPQRWRRTSGLAASGGWAAAGPVYPALPRAGVWVRRCHDVALTEALLLGRDSFSFYL